MGLKKKSRQEEVDLIINHRSQWNTSLHLIETPRMQTANLEDHLLINDVQIIQPGALPPKEKIKPGALPPKEKITKILGVINSICTYSCGEWLSEW